MNSTINQLFITGIIINGMHSLTSLILRISYGRIAQLHTVSLCDL